MSARSGVCLAEAASSRENNFLIIRLGLAVLVLVTHAYYFSDGDLDREPLFRATRSLNLGFVAVDMFFVFSGFLIVKSWVERGNLADFLAARFLRIYPAVWVCTLFMLAVAFFISGHGAAEFFGSRATVKWLAKNSTLFYSYGHDLPGVFQGNPVPGDTNLQFWTLVWEVRLYAITAIGGALGFFRRRWWVLGLTAVLAVAYATGVRGDPAGASPDVRLPAFFFLGACAYLFRDRIRLCWPAFFAAAAVMAGVLALAPHSLPWVELLPLPYAALCLVYLLKGPITRFSRAGDYSYGTYIFGGFVGQFFVWLHPGAGPWTHFAAVLPITLALAILSWHFVERPALRLRPKIRLKRGSDAPPAPLPT